MPNYDMKKIYLDEKNIKQLGYPIADNSTLYVHYKPEGVDIARLPTEGYEEIIHYDQLGIQRDSLASSFIVNLGTPFEEGSFFLNTKKEEVEVIEILSKYFGLPLGDGMGYVTQGGTEGNLAGLWWSKLYLVKQKALQLQGWKQEIEKFKAQEKDIENLIQSQDMEKVFSINTIKTVLQLHSQIKLLEQNILQATQPVVLISDQAHYSIAKIAGILGLPYNIVKTDDNGSINLVDFETSIMRQLAERPEGAIIAQVNACTTVKGGIDDVVHINSILNKYFPKSGYTIHMDAALLGLTLPITKPFGESIKDYFHDLGVNTLAISGHKFPGLVNVCGLALTTKSFLQDAFSTDENTVAYIGNLKDWTVAGSRSGFNVILLHDFVHSVEIDTSANKFKKIVQQSLDNTDYLTQELQQIYNKEYILHNPNQFNVVFPRPSDSIMAKYTLMPAGDKAAACILPHVDKSLINEFINDLKQETKIIANPKIQMSETDSLEGSPENALSSVSSQNSETTAKPYNVSPDSIEIAEAMSKSLVPLVNKITEGIKYIPKIKIDFISPTKFNITIELPTEDIVGDSLRDNTTDLTVLGGISTEGVSYWQ